MAIGSTDVFMAAALCGIIVLLLHRREWLQMYIKAAKLPGPRALPLIGNGHQFVGNAYDIMDAWRKLMNTYSSPIRVWFGHRLFTVVFDPEDVKKVYNSQYTIEKSYLYDFLHPWLGMGLLTAPAKKWRDHRKLIAPTFNKRILDSFVETFAKQSTIMTEHMGKELEAGDFDVYHYINQSMLDIVFETTMGVKMNTQENYSRYGDALNSTTETVRVRLFQFWLHSDLIFNLSKTARDQREHLKYLNGVTDDVIQIKKRFYNNATLVGKGSENTPPATRKAFLDLLMDVSDNGTKLTAEELREEVNTMMAACNVCEAAKYGFFQGFHTTSTLTTFVAVMLANNPEVQVRAYRELCDIYGDQVSSESPVKKEDLNHMEYLERVIKETLRLFPPVGIISRHVTEDLDIGEYTLPKGSSIGIGILNIHRSEKYWPDPMKFDPDRFLPEEVAKRNPFCYIPFSAGPRNCIGQTYAMMSTKVMVATILRRYVLKRDTFLDINYIRLSADILKPTKAMTIRISERTNKGVEK